MGKIWILSQKNFILAVPQPSVSPGNCLGIIISSEFHFTRVALGYSAVVWSLSHKQAYENPWDLQ